MSAYVFSKLHTNLFKKKLKNNIYKNIKRHLRLKFILLEHDVKWLKSNFDETKNYSFFEAISSSDPDKVTFIPGFIFMFELFRIFQKLIFFLFNFYR